MARLESAAISRSVPVTTFPGTLIQQKIAGDQQHSLSLDFSNEINTVAVDIASSRTGFYGTVTGYVAGAGSFADITDLSIVMTAGSDNAQVKASAIEGRARLSLDAGEGRNDEDALGIDLSGLRNVTFEVDASGSAISNYGSFLNFERFAVTLGSGVNRVRTGDGDDRITSIGVDTVDGGAGIDRWFGNYQTSRIGLTFHMNGASGTLSNGTTLKDIECYFLNTGSGDDVFDIVHPVSKDGQGINGGSGFDTLHADLSKSAFDTSSFGIQSVGEKGYSGVLGGDDADLGFRNIEALDVVYGAVDDRGTVNTGSISRVGGSLSIDGGDGYDTVTVPALRAGYAIESDGKGGFVVDDIDRSNGDTGWFTIRNFEALAFGDQTVDLATLLSPAAMPAPSDWIDAPPQPFAVPADLYF